MKGDSRAKGCVTIVLRIATMRFVWSEDGQRYLRAEVFYGMAGVGIVLRRAGGLPPAGRVHPLRPGGGGHLVLSPDGNYLYVSSRLQGDGIATFAVKLDGSLEKCAYTPTGRHPRHFCLSPGGELLLVACRDDNMIQFFDRSASDGSLSGSGLCLEVEKPVYIEAYEED